MCPNPARVDGRPNRAIVPVGMNTTLTPEQIAFYRENGFVLHRNLLAPAEMAELKTAVLDTVQAMGKKKFAEDSIEGEEGENFYDKVFTQRVNLWRINPTVKRYMLDRTLGRALCQLSGRPGYRMWHDQTLIKEPFGNATAWHLDNPNWSFYSPDSISIWIALEDATVENGCMWFVPGTPRFARYEHSPIGYNMADLFKVYPEMAKIETVPAVMKAGDCSFHNGLTAHGAGANMTRRRRIAMVGIYMPVGSTFNGVRNVLPKPYFESLKPGDVLANDDWNPVVYAEGKSG